MTLVYVESNFVCELAFEQEEASDCEELLALARAGQIELLLPAFALVEPRWSVPNRARSSQEKAKLLETVLADIKRSGTLGAEGKRLEDELNSLLLLHQEAVDLNLERACRAMLAVATVLPMTADIVTDAAGIVAEFGIKGYFDALMLASVLADLRRRATPPASSRYFLNRNVRDFGTPEVVRALRGLGCDVIGSFGHGYRRIRRQLSN